jgi:hypothetical protein
MITKLLSFFNFNNIKSFLSKKQKTILNHIYLLIQKEKRVITLTN